MDNNKVIIREPIWKNRSISIAKHKVGEGCDIEIAYKDKYGNRVFPHLYFLSKEKALSCPTVLSGGTPCWNIPINELEKRPGRA